MAHLTLEQRTQALSAGVAGAVVSYMAREALTYEAAFEKAQAAKESRRQRWLTSIIDPLAQKHGTTREVVLSLLFCNTPIDGPDTQEAFWSESQDFAEATLAEMGLTARPLGHQRCAPRDTSQAR